MFVNFLKIAFLFYNLSVYVLLVISQNETSIMVELDSFEIDKSYDTKYVDWKTLRMIRKSRNLFVVNGTVETNLNLDNEQSVRLLFFLVTCVFIKLKFYPIFRYKYKFILTILIIK